ncbi:MAG: repair protein RecN [Gemmatimonadetes bacterium]|nr:repair protein RecN [Gemmatimonadota bacterium]
MIVELRVRDLATIADVTLSLGPGLNVLTGETGAGKSMIVDALALLLGARADTGAIRPGAARALIEGSFEDMSPALSEHLDTLGLESDEGRLVIRREISAEGRSRAWINGSPTAVGVLASVGRGLVDLHGQHETQTLLQPERQRDVLDAYADAQGLAQQVAAAAAEVHRLAGEEEALTARRDDVRRRADYLRHVVSEIEQARLKTGEDDALDLEARRLSQAGTLADHAQRVALALDGEAESALAGLGRADRALGALERADPSVSAWREMLDGAYANLQEVARLAAEYAAGLEEDPDRLAEIERRRDLIYRLKQKYGETIGAVASAGRQAAEELDLLDRSEFDLKAIADRRRLAEAELERLALLLTEKRRAGADRLARSVNRLLPRLGLPGGRLEMELVPLPRPGATGGETVQLLVCLNEGMETRPLARSASGGELSRVMLAIKVVLGRHDEIPTLVFDEVDAGIGGETGRQVGDALADVAGRHQVLVITHLAPVAARADRHLAIAKRPRGGVATSDVQILHGEDRVNELARMLGDAEADTARRHALALLNERRPVRG